MIDVIPLGHVQINCYKATSMEIKADMTVRGQAITFTDETNTVTVVLLLTKSQFEQLREVVNSVTGL